MVAVAVVLTVAGLRVGEMAGIKVRGLDGIRGTINFWDEKVNRRTYSRRVGPSALRWVRFLHWWEIRKLGRTQHDKIFSGPRQLERVMAKLFVGSKWQEVRWHGWRRLCAATLYQAGTPMPSIKAWCRWRSTQTARGYAEWLEEGTIKLVSKWPKAPNPVSKDMFAKRSSRLEVHDVWPARLFPNDVLSNSDDNNVSGECSASTSGGSDTQARTRRRVPTKKSCRGARA